MVSVGVLLKDNMGRACRKIAFQLGHGVKLRSDQISDFHSYSRFLFCVECVVKNSICLCILLTTCILRYILLLDVFIDIRLCFYSLFKQAR